jgi:hypothetical protein
MREVRKVQVSSSIILELEPDGIKCFMNGMAGMVYVTKEIHVDNIWYPDHENISVL